MWPLFKCLNIDNILSVCEIALAPTGRVLFFSRHPAMLGVRSFFPSFFLIPLSLASAPFPYPYQCIILLTESRTQIAVATIKYLVELRGWNGIALPAVHARDARIYIEDPGPWIIGMASEMRYAIRPPADVCVCDL